MSQYSFLQKTFAVPARLAFTFILLAVPFMAGMSAASPWYILAIFPVFVMADVLGKWRLQFQGKPMSVLLKFLISAAIAQPIVVGVVYLLGRGVGSLMGGVETLPFRETINWPLMGGYAGIVLLSGLILMLMERGKAAPADAIEAEIDQMLNAKREERERTEGLNAPATRLTIETFFDGHHYSHYKTNDDEEREVDPEVAFVTEEAIGEVEAKLGVRLPEMLRALYLSQNGGSVRNVFSGNADNPQDDDCDPFGGYEDMVPLVSLRSLHASISDYAYDEQTEMFPKGAKQMIVLAQWYRVTLFLDYRDGRETPRVGFYDFDRSADLQDDTWEDDAVFWPNFDAFFATLYRQKRHG